MACPVPDDAHIDSLLSENFEFLATTLDSLLFVVTLPWPDVVRGCSISPFELRLRVNQWLASGTHGFAHDRIAEGWVLLKNIAPLFDVDIHTTETAEIRHVMQEKMKKGEEVYGRLEEALDRKRVADRRYRSDHATARLPLPPAHPHTMPISESERERIIRDELEEHFVQCRNVFRRLLSRHLDEHSTTHEALDQLKTKLVQQEESIGSLKREMEERFAAVEEGDALVKAEIIGKLVDVTETKLYMKGVDERLARIEQMLKGTSEDSMVG